MLKPFLIVSSMVMAGAFVSSPQAPSAAAPPAEFKIPAEAVSQANPIKTSAESLSRAKKIYGYECAVCHGENGSGAGDLSKNMKAKMPDFRDPSALKARTDGEIFYIIKNGMGEMEGEGGRVKPDDTWNLVNYVRSFSKGQTSTTAQGPG